jgi:hypothetical protein
MREDFCSWFVSSIQFFIKIKEKNKREGGKWHARKEYFDALRGRNLGVSVMLIPTPVSRTASMENDGKLFITWASLAASVFGSSISQDSSFLALPLQNVTFGFIRSDIILILCVSSVVSNLSFIFAKFKLHERLYHLRFC